MINQKHHKFSKHKISETHITFRHNWTPKTEKKQNFQQTHLAIKRSWIMPGPEHVKQSIEAALLRVILNPNDLRMVRGPRTHILIGGIVKEPLGVPDLSLGHTRGSLKRELHAPETTRSELRELLTRGRNVVVWALSNRRVGCGLLGPWGTKAQFVQEVHGGGERLGESFQGSESVKVFSGFGETVEERFGEWGGGGGGGGGGARASAVEERGGDEGGGGRG